MEFQITGENLWDKSVITVEVKEGEDLIGHILFDLFPRENKCSSTFCSSILSPALNEKSTFDPALAVIIANFSDPQFFRFHELKTLFHEFGHAMHAILGRSEMLYQSSFSTPKDFAEAPSQLLEDWCFDKTVLKRLSRHYQTDLPLSDSLIEMIQKERDFNDEMSYENSLSLVSLMIHQGKEFDFFELDKQIYQNTPQVIAHTHLPYFCSFAHLAFYGAKYYSYDWSKQLALQMFECIKAHGGPLDRAMGMRYRTKVLGKGGSQDPNELIADFIDFKINPIHN